MGDQGPVGLQGSPSLVALVDTAATFEQVQNLLLPIAASLDTLKADMATLKQDVVGLKQHFADLRQDVVDLRQDVAVLKQDCGELKSDAAGLKTSVAGVQRDVHGLKVYQTRSRTRAYNAILHGAGEELLPMGTIEPHIRRVTEIEAMDADDLSRRIRDLGVDVPPNASRRFLVVVMMVELGVSPVVGTTTTVQ